MRILSTLYTATIILFGTNVIFGMTSQLEVSPQPADSNTPPSKQSEKVTTLRSDRHPSDIDPALLKPSKNSIFDDILSPELFSQTYPFDYLLSKAKDIPAPELRKMMRKLKAMLNSAQIPKKYVPYAKVLYSLSECLCKLKSGAKQDILEIQHSSGSVYPTLSPEICASDVELCELFSTEIFAEVDPISRLVYKLLDIPENEVQNVGVRLRNLTTNGDIPELYLKYGASIGQFLYADTRFVLVQLRRDIADMRRVIIFDSNDISDIDFPSLRLIYF